MKVNKNETIKKIHLGFSILKFLLAFDVIRSHCFKEKSTSNKLILYLTKKRRVHVPSFTIMSFYFTHNTLISFDLNKIYKRFERLLIPYLGWPFFIFITNNFLFIFCRINFRCTFKNLIYQIILAQAPNMTFHFWFIFDLISFTSFFALFLRVEYDFKQKIKRVIK